MKRIIINCLVNIKLLIFCIKASYWLTRNFDLSKEEITKIALDYGLYIQDIKDVVVVDIDDMEMFKAWFLESKVWE